MKMRNLMAVVVLLAAIGSAVASERLMAAAAWTSKIDVPAQAGDCQLRGDCTGSGVACTITLDHDGNSGTAPISVPFRDGVAQANFPCGVQLSRN